LRFQVVFGSKIREFANRRAREAKSEMKSLPKYPCLYFFHFIQKKKDPKDEMNVFSNIFIL
jgi:hypothetical protein